MQFVKELAHQFMPELSTSAKLSIACISTTNPVYLVFSDQSLYPDLVIRIADTEHVRKAHQVTQDIFNQVGGLVPEPIALSNLNGLSISVQRGVKGTPWFQLSQDISTPTQWNELRARAIAALNQLHQGAAKIESWQAECSPGDALRECLKQCIETGTDVSMQVIRQVEIMSKKLDFLGVISVYPQHGDYCLNNLIVEVDALHIIDFEDFGMTSMPLHDEFSLALSFYAQAPCGINSSLLRELKECTAKGVDDFGISTDMLPGFFMYHLLLRLGEWSQGGRRDKYRTWLISILEKFTSEPHLFFD